MAAPVIPCDSCGSPIPDSDLETGTAITLLGKRYCVGCKTEAIQGVSLDDLGGRAAAPARPAPPKPAPPAPGAKPAPRPAAAPVSKTPSAEQRPPPPKPAPKAAAPPPAPPERKPAPRKPAPSVQKSSRAPLLIAAGGVVVVVAIVAGVVLSRPPAPGKSGGSTTTKGGTTTPETAPAVSPQDREAQAREAFAKVDDIARRSGASWDHLLAAIDKAKPACRGTAWEKKLDELRVRAVQEKEAEEAARELAPLMDELKGAVATDPEFKRYAELQVKFQQALEMAGKTGSAKMPEIRALQKEYNGKYEKLAEPYYADINEAATQLADERRYDDALRKINTFPPHLRLSSTWASLEKLKLDIERRKKDALPKKK